MVQINTQSSNNIVLKLDGYTSGAVDITFTNQLTEKTYQISLTPTISNARYAQFVYPAQTGADILIEGLYLVTFVKGALTLATRLCYASKGATPLSESSYTEYTTGDSDNDYVYIP
tara:strand:- start:269 stop:616 length:348 start_codon:yes stop_codon:yes gene_type:complete